MHVRIICWTHILILNEANRPRSKKMDFGGIMVRVAATTSDPRTAWRVRDTLAAHPMLGGGMANIRVAVDHSRVVLEGWTMDAGIYDLAIRLAARSAGHRAVAARLTVENCRRHCTVPSKQ